MDYLYNFPTNLKCNLVPNIPTAFGLLPNAHHNPKPRRPLALVSLISAAKTLQIY